jgi:hypothetical protein
MTPFKKYLPEDLTVVNIIKFLLPNLKIYIKRNIKLMKKNKVVTDKIT